MRLIYNILFNIGLCFAAPWYFARMVRRGNWRGGFAERFGRYDARLKQALTNRHVIWLHAVSVGEVNLCLRLMEVMEPQLPNYKLLVSTTTSTGMAELKKRLPSHISPIYFPIDRKKYVQRAMSLIHPEAVILVEAEIWPNFLWALQRRDIPCFLVNARMSQRSWRGYKRWSAIFRPLFRAFAGVGAQSEEDARRLEAVGCRPEVVQVMGSLKFDSAKLGERRVLDVNHLLSQLGVDRNALVVVGGSTHAGEEVLLARAMQRLKAEFPQAFLVLVPRHHERGREVGAALEEAGVRSVFRTEITPATSLSRSEVDCLIVNTTGELRFFYERADIVFVGKSLTASASGGQNPIEPAAIGKAVMFGPNMQNFPQVVPQFLEEDAAVCVPDATQLEGALRTLLSSPERRAILGQRARQVVLQNQGGLERTAAMIVDELRARHGY